MTVTDPAGVKRRESRDALGWLTLARENNPATGNIDSGYYNTSYVYDALDNLTRVTQASQRRDFTYDSLSPPSDRPLDQRQPDHAVRRGPDPQFQLPGRDRHHAAFQLRHRDHGPEQAPAAGLDPGRGRLVTDPAGPAGPEVFVREAGNAEKQRQRVVDR